MDQEASVYFETNHINAILESIVTGLSHARPQDPIRYMEQCLSKIRDGELLGKRDLRWDTFLPKKKPPLDPHVAKATAYGPKKHRFVAPLQGMPVARTYGKGKALPGIGRTVNPMQNVVFVLGGPGSGKGTQCVRLAKEFNLAHLSVGDLLRNEVSTGSAVGRQLEAFMKEGKIVPMDITLQLLGQAIQSVSGTYEGYLIDGFPREMEQAKAFEAKIGVPKTVLYFDCPENVMEARLLKRGQTSGRADDNAETIKKRFKTFVNQSYPVVEFYRRKGKLIEVSSEPPVEQVYNELRSQFEAVWSQLNHPNIVFVLGGPGSGKGTQCTRLAKEFKLTHLSTGDLLRAELDAGTEIGKQAEGLMKEGKIVPMDIILGLLRKAIQENIDTPGFLIDGFPRAMDQALEFERTIGKCRMVLFYSCPLQVLEARLLERGKTSGRADDNIDTIRKRFQTFEQQSMPVVDHYANEGRLFKIVSDKPIDAVYAESKRLFEQTKPTFDGENIVFVLGGPGSGKGTQCERLVKTLNYAHLSTGDLLRDEVKKGSPLGRELDALMREGKMVPIEITLKLLVNAMEAKRGAPGFLIDGFPRTLDQAIQFEQSIGKCKFVLFYDAPQETLVQRLLKRGETSGRSDDNMASIQKRIQVFIEQSLPVIEHFQKSGRVKKVQSEGNVDDITRVTLPHFADVFLAFGA